MTSGINHILPAYFPPSAQYLKLQQIVEVAV